MFSKKFKIRGSKNNNAFKSIKLNYSMERPIIRSKGTILTARFFKESNLQITGSRNAWKIYDSLDNKAFLGERTIRSNKDELLGEISEIYIDSLLRPSIIYTPFKWPKGCKQYDLQKKLAIEASDEEKWREFMLDPTAKEDYKGLNLRLPERHYLEIRKT